MFRTCFSESDKQCVLGSKKLHTLLTGHVDHEKLLFFFGDRGDELFTIKGVQ